MSPSHIEAGRVYGDGKHGLRQVLEVSGAPLRVLYRLLAAKAVREWDVRGNEVSLLGKDHWMTLESFASWAKVSYELQAGLEVAEQLAAMRIVLAPGEKAFMERIFQQLGRPAEAGLVLASSHTEGRAVGGLERKDLLKRRSRTEVELTALGAARLRFAARTL